jgi:ferredoxin
LIKTIENDTVQKFLLYLKKKQMKIQLRYFTGTGNSLKVLNTCKDAFVKANHDVEISEISLEEKSISEADILGFSFPVYAFAIPRFARKYLKNLKEFKNKQKVFILITAGDFDEAGFSIRECEEILSKKNCEIIYSSVIEMPINWTISMNPPSENEYLPIINKGVEKAKIIASDILNGNKKFHAFNYPKRFNKFGYYHEYFLFRYLGVSNLWRNFRVYETCNGCALCSKICPTQSIKMVNKKPIWNSSCEQCMRCVNFCTNQAIYHAYGGETKGKNRYFEPSFKPKKR